MSMLKTGKVIDGVIGKIKKEELEGYSDNALEEADKLLKTLDSDDSDILKKKKEKKK